MGVADGTVLGAVKIVDNGSPAERFNLVLVAEGFQKGELSQFAGHAEHFLTGLFGTAPFNRHHCAINVWRLDVASNQSGADDPAGSCGGTGASPKTYFDARFCAGGVPRALSCDSSLVLTTVAAHVPQFHSAQVIVNSSKYGGTGGSVGVSSIATVNASGAAVDWREILIHEMGHSIFGLADEYWYYQGCDVNEPAQNQYTGGEPAQPNVTASKTAQGKWSDLINQANLPTWHNPHCNQCPPEPGQSGAPPDTTMTVGTYEGAFYHHCGAYRPSPSCKMRKLGAPFCSVCRRVIDEYLDVYDPPFCLEDLKQDLSKWAAVATILFGVIQDGGGVIFIGGKPVPIDPWGPVRHSLWGALANPRHAPPAMRDVLVGRALLEITSLIADNRLRQDLTGQIQGLLHDAVAELPAGTIR